MGNIIKITKFHLLTLFTRVSLVMLAILILQVIISVVATNLVKAAHPFANPSAGTTDLITLPALFAIGILFFRLSFEFMLSHGVSRKRFFSASCISLAVMAAIWAVMVALFAVISREFTHIFILYQSLYHSLDFVGVAVWEFAFLLLAAVLGWFIYLIYDVSSRNAKLLISAAPFIVWSLLWLFNTIAEGKVFEAIGQFFITIMGLNSNVLNPYIGTLSLLILAGIFGGAVFLLVQKVQIK